MPEQHELTHDVVISVMIVLVCIAAFAGGVLSTLAVVQPCK